MRKSVIWKEKVYIPEEHVEDFWRHYQEDVGDLGAYTFWKFVAEMFSPEYDLGGEHSAEYNRLHMLKPRITIKKGILVPTLREKAWKMFTGKKSKQWRRYDMRIGKG